MEKARISLDDRINLQAAIQKAFSLEECANLLHKSRSTIYREIINNSYYKPCRRTCFHCSLRCVTRETYVHGECQKFIAYRCYHWKEFPYTCNKCSSSSDCTHLKRYYDCIEANELSKTNRKAPRVYRGIDEEDLRCIDDILTEQIKEKGQSLHHAYMSNDYLQRTCSERTLRRYIYKGYLTVKAHHLPRYVRYSHKYDYTKKKIVNVERLLGRTYSDYLKFVNEHPYSVIWQYDSVEGKVEDKKAILTITFPETRFQFGYLISKGNSVSVYRKIRKLQELFKGDYENIFMVNLSDNGPEFAKFHELEFDEYEQRLCYVFFTKPYKSTDKAECERNHEFIRYVIPKGKSLDFLTQKKMNLLFSHINSYIRESNKNKTPYQLTVERFELEFMRRIGIEEIPTKDVILKPRLLK